MRDYNQHVDESALHGLMQSDDDSDETLAVVSHVETCDECLERLNRLATQDGIAEEAAFMLSDYSDDSPPRSTSDASVEVPDCLQKASHPEMLGRLGRYDIERSIGAGGMGVVLKGFDTELNRPVAVKVLASHLAHSGAARQRFAREAKAVAAVVHEHVVAIHDVETEGDVPYLVMQYVAGESLHARVQREGPLDAKQILRIGIQAAAGLAAAHEQGVIHRDIKPANILLESSVERVLLTDFGLARTVDDASLTHTGIVTGTPHYMSPEQANGIGSDHRTDLFSLGSVLYFMATGYPPFRAERAMGVLHRICNEQHRPVWESNPDVPDELADVIDRLLQKKPSRRFHSADALRESLTSLLGQMQHPSPRWVRRLRRQVVHHSHWIASIVAITFAAVCVFASLTDTKNVASGPESDSSKSEHSASGVELQPAFDNAENAIATATLDSVEAERPTPESGSASPSSPFNSPAISMERVSDLEREYLNLKADIDSVSGQAEGVFYSKSTDMWNLQIESLQQHLDDIDRLDSVP